MECREPLETLRQQLLRKGLPADYVGRAVQELADHHADLVHAAKEGSAGSTEAAWQQLGSVESLTTELARKYHQRTFAGRHPVLTFLVAPLPAMLLLWAGTFAGTWGTLSVVGEALVRSGQEYWLRDVLTPENRMAVWLAYAMHLATLVVPPTVGALWYCRLARRSGRGIRWAMASCVLVTLLACIVFSDFHIPVGQEQGMLTIGVNVTLFPWDWRLPQGQWLQTFAPLVVLAIAVWRAYREQPLPRAEQAVA